MNVNRISQDQLRLYGANSRAVQGDEAAQAADATKNAAESGGATGANQADSVAISPQVRDLSRVLGIVKSAPDIRADRVAALRQQVQDGTYQVSDEDVAARLLSPGLK